MPIGGCPATSAQPRASFEGAARPHVSAADARHAPPCLPPLPVLLTWHGPAEPCLQSGVPRRVCSAELRRPHERCWWWLLGAKAVGHLRFQEPGAGVYCALHPSRLCRTPKGFFRDSRAALCTVLHGLLRSRPTQNVLPREANTGPAERGATRLGRGHAVAQLAVCAQRPAAAMPAEGGAALVTQAAGAAPAAAHHTRRELLEALAGDARASSCASLLLPLLARGALTIHKSVAPWVPLTCRAPSRLLLLQARRADAPRGRPRQLDAAAA